MDKELKMALETMTAEANPVRVEQAVRERIAKEEVPAETRRHPGGYRKPIRAVLAAAMVLVLAGSVYAAVQVQKRLTVTLPEDGPVDVVMKVPEEAGEMIVLSEEKRKELQAHVVTQEDIKNGIYAEKYRLFDTWAEAAEWLGCGLLTSDVLTEVENKKWGNVRLWVNGDIYPTLGDQTSVTLFGVVSSPLLEKTGKYDGSGLLTVTIPLSGNWENYGRSMVYLTDTGYDENEDGTIEINWNEIEKQSTGELVTQYTTTSGIQAEIAVMTARYGVKSWKAGNTWETEIRENLEAFVYFLHGGILYELRLGPGDVESGVEAAKAIMDSMG